MQGAPPLAHLGPAAELHLQAAVPSARSGSRGQGRPGIDLHTQPHLSAAAGGFVRPAPCFLPGPTCLFWLLGCYLRTFTGT